ncbi:MAG: prephenate dehydrogenase/arogenate dehydrogenase family protein, partial [Candidatus Omnitrophica bacterium CG12_big_fil_rev_8_21_14_0_65_42_8]
MFKKITIIGLGLIGGSLALAIRKKELAKEIIG